MERDMERKMAYINGEWSQALSKANSKIADLILDNEALHEENRKLKSEQNKQKDSSQ